MMRTDFILSLWSRPVKRRGAPHCRATVIGPGVPDPLADGFGDTNEACTQQPAQRAQGADGHHFQTAAPAHQGGAAAAHVQPDVATQAQPLGAQMTIERREARAHGGVGGGVDRGQVRHRVRRVGAAAAHGGFLPGRRPGIGWGGFWTGGIPIRVDGPPGGG